MARWLRQWPSRSWLPGSSSGGIGCRRRSACSKECAGQGLAPRPATYTRRGAVGPKEAGAPIQFQSTHAVPQRGEIFWIRAAGTAGGAHSRPAREGTGAHAFIGGRTFVEPAASAPRLGDWGAPDTPNRSLKWRSGFRRPERFLAMEGGNLTVCMPCVAAYSLT